MRLLALHSISTNRVKLLKQKDKNASPEWLTKLPQMVKQLEVSLYRSAPSFEAYSDTSTLKARLQQLAMEIAKKTQQAKDGGSGGGGNDGGRQQQSSSSSSHGQSRRSSSGVDPMQQPQAQQQNFNMSSSSRNNESSSNNAGGSSGGGGSEAFTSQHGNPNDPEWKVRIRHKQQRLLLLHHSSKCLYEDGNCKVTPYCGEMKKLWKHMARCTDNECRVPHCFSSRSILSHYRKCKDPRCPACGPVRETVRKTQKSSSSGGRSSSGGGSGRQGLGDIGGIGPGGQGSGGSNNYGMPQDNNSSSNYGMPQDAMGGMQQPSNNMGMMQQQGGSGNNMGPPQQMGNVGPSSSQQMPNGMSSMMQGQQQMSSGGPMDGMMNGMMSNNGQGSMQQQVQQPNNNMFPPDQQNQSNMSMGPPQQQSQSGGNNQMVNNANTSSQQMMPHGASSDDPNEVGANDIDRSQGRAEPDAKARHKRQRLLLLRHASKCNAVGNCTVTPHCAEMKVLWKHIANCKDSYCKVRHCMSSRYVLSHYRRCKPPCNICDPVKKIIKDGLNYIEVDPAIMEGMTVGGSGGGAPVSGMVRTTPPVDESMQQPQTKRPKLDHPQSSTSSGGDGAAMAAQSISSTPQNMPPTLSSAPPPQPSASDSAHSSGQVPPNVPAPKQSGSSGNAVEGKKSPKPSSSSPTDDHALLECFTTEQVKTHIQSLKKFAKLAPNELKNKCLEVLKGLQTHEHGWVFATPVNPVELGLDDYFDIIKKPMDLGTIQKKLDGGSYHSFDDFRSDVRLTFENAMKYNEERTVVHEMAKELKKKFEVDFKKLMKQLDKEHAENSKKVQACGLCGCEKLNFEPPVFFCNGANCPTKRIRRNTHFYITADKQYAWCNQCFGELKGDMVECGATKVKKADLTKRKNDEVHEESWVQCDDCERWIHQICGLYNTRHDKDNSSAYSCPLCLLEKRKKDGDPTNLPEAPSAHDIPRTKLSDKLEKDVHKKLNVRMKELAEEKAELEVSTCSTDEILFTGAL